MSCNHSIMHYITLAGISIRLDREEGKGHTMSVSSSLPHTFLFVSLCMRRRVQKHKSVGLQRMFLNPRLGHMLCDTTARMPEELCHRILNRLHSCRTHLRRACVHVEEEAVHQGLCPQTGTIMWVVKQEMWPFQSKCVHTQATQEATGWLV